MTQTQEKLAKMADTLAIGHYQRHVFLCIGEACCSADVGQAAWDALKKELKDKNLSLSRGPGACYRTKVQCLRVCSDGPVAVVYPEGTYYYGLTAERIPEFVQKHLIDGQPIEERIFARNPLPMVSSEPDTGAT
jgi:(2Fe-2S) ferredoxin